MAATTLAKLGAYGCWRRSDLIALAASAVLLIASACGAAPPEVQEDTFTVAGPAEIVVNSENGSIKIKAGSDSEVHVLAEIRDAERVRYALSQENDRITVDVRINRQRPGPGENPGADITITTPARTDVELRTSNGRIEVQGIEGSGYLQTSNGNIVLKDVKGAFEGVTSNGPTNADGLEGTAVLRSSNGGANLRNTKGEVDVETTNGPISFTGELTPGGGNRLVTTNGDVDITLQGTPSIDLDAATTNGEVISELPVTATSTGAHLVGTIGDGEAEFYIRTSNGDVTVR